MNRFILITIVVIFFGSIDAIVNDFIPSFVDIATLTYVLILITDEKK